MPTMPSSDQVDRAGRTGTSRPPAARSAASPPRVRPPGGEQQGGHLRRLGGPAAPPRTARRRRCHRSRPAAAPGRRRPRPARRAAARRGGPGRRRPAASASPPAACPSTPASAARTSATRHTALMPPCPIPFAGGPDRPSRPTSSFRDHHRRGDPAVVRQREMPVVDPALRRPPPRPCRRRSARAGRPGRARSRSRASCSPAGAPSALATASLAANRAASDSGERGLPERVCRSASVKSRSASSGVRARARANRSTRTTSMPTATITTPPYRRPRPQISRRARAGQRLWTTRGTPRRRLSTGHPRDRPARA